MDICSCSEWRYRYDPIYAGLVRIRNTAIGCHWAAPLEVGTPSLVKVRAMAQVLTWSSSSSWYIRRTTAAAYSTTSK